MDIRNCGNGVHPREVKGVERLKKELPGPWFAFTNLDLVLGPGKAREIDMIIVADRRVFLVDIKDWHGKIEERDGRWRQNGQDRDSSPVQKINGIAREVSIRLAHELKKRPETKSEPTPSITGLVLLTAGPDISGIQGLDREKVFHLDDFIKQVKSDAKQRETFGDVAAAFLVRPLTEPFWKDKLSRFFNAGANSPFKGGRRRFQRFLAEDSATFVHPTDIYREYNAEEEGNRASLGVLRLWDFTKSPDGRFQTQEGRLEIAGREQQVYHWLKDRSETIERSLLTPRVDDPDRGVDYWEVYDRRRRMKRLGEFATTEAPRLLVEERLELARQLLYAVATMHGQESSHLDLGDHSIWLETPTSVRLSHLMSARFPDAKSLGQSRYQFLSSSMVPEDVFGLDQGPKRKDVYLLGVTVHKLLFGVAPAGEPPEWNPEVDKDGELVLLHPWFSVMLDMDPAGRFADATAALSAFNSLTSAKPSGGKLLGRLDQYRGELKSQRQFNAAHPEIGSLIVETDRLDVWQTTTSHGTAIVKLWKQAAWGDITKEAGSVLAFLDRARELKADALPGLAPVREALWLGDAVGLVQDWIDGRTLAEEIADVESANWTAEEGLSLAAGLIRNAQNLHDRAFAHGDLKPSNIVLRAEAEPIFIDALDYSPSSDGEITSSLYAPEVGTAYERDRYALTKITEEILTNTDIQPEIAADIVLAIKVVREKTPALATLAPLLESVLVALDKLERLHANSDSERPTLRISLVGAKSGKLESDEGYLFLRFRRDPANSLFFVIRGACEEASFRLDGTGKPVSGRRTQLEQGWIARSAKFEFHMIDNALEVSGESVSDLSAIAALLADPVVHERLNRELSSSDHSISQVQVAADSVELPAVEDEAEDQLAEETQEYLALQRPANVDVPSLWRALMDAEHELTTEGEARLDSSFDKTTGRHSVVIELDSGDFEFSRDDTVGVERLDKKGAWRRIGRLDLDRSKPDLVVIIPDAGFSFYGANLVDEGQRLRFVSHFEVQSLKRRSSAVGRILDGHGRAPNLLSVFDPRSNIESTSIKVDVKDDELEIYGFNSDQLAAFRQIVSVRPVGILQGPPGTGKTRFIAALAHYALTKGLARNVLISSQSHEAVNTAAEAVLKLFRKTGVPPDLLRVGMNDGQVSEALRPYHTAHVEQGYKDRFAAMFAERMAVAGLSLGLPTELISDIVALESRVRPVIDRIADMVANPEIDSQRVNGLIETIRDHLKSIDVETELPNNDGTELEWRNVTERVALHITRRAGKNFGVSPDRVNNLRSVAAIAKDFISSVSRANRSFDTFLAGTRQIVAGTCVGLGRSSLGLTTTPFDLVIVDEAARCTAGELLVPLQAARWAVMVGDQAQLEPQVDGEVVTMVSNRTSIQKGEIKRSDFERVFESDYGKMAGAKLQTQYRMLPPIGELVSETFYGDLTLLPGRSRSEIDPEVLPPGMSDPLVWVATDGLGESAFEKSISNSKQNRGEADTIVAMLESWLSHTPFKDWLTTQSIHPIGIGIICMYAAQRNLVETRLRQSPIGSLLDRHIKVGTVDSYQGKENPIVIVSLVRNNRDGPVEAGRKTIKDGFLTVPNRINVAASRAMDRLVLVGARKAWRRDSSMGSLSANFEKQIKAGAATVLEAEDVLESLQQTPNAAGDGGKRGKEVRKDLL
ncbi:AAA domain-containing protein [Rhizobium sp. 42MFCr.1]|uniref:AAA domain-containing protein n=1 Tax=Rhizobium sp. 42MFCr.1 TaxID=1048680 RepID=UPI000374FDBD|nr:AAA domain-containing protein [Rhizobium sp. 42MFCr.1]